MQINVLNIKPVYAINILIRQINQLLSQGE